MKFMNRGGNSPASSPDSSKEKVGSGQNANKWSRKRARDVVVIKQDKHVERSKGTFSSGRRSFGGYNPAVQKFQSQLSAQEKKTEIDQQIDTESVGVEEMSKRFKSSSSSTTKNAPNPPTTKKNTSTTTNRFKPKTQKKPKHN